MKSAVKNFILICVFICLQVVVDADESLAKDKKFRLLSGDFMPLVGFGTYKINGTELIKETLDYAIGAGYRMIDSAAAYKNEEDIGKALKQLLPKYNLTRQDIFITSKLASTDHGEKAYASLEESLRKLDCEYIDLYLIHWPGKRGENASHEVNFRKRNESWQQLIKGVKNGLTKNIGVSNYNVRHLSELLANSHGMKPAVNQVEWHPHYHQEDLFDLCKREGILLEAYSSLGGTGNTNLLEDTDVKKIANKLNKTSAQVLLRWALQRNIAIIPKARSKKYIDENIDLNFVIPDEDMTTLSNLSTRKGKKYLFNPDKVA